MCGLVGVFGKNPINARTIIRSLLVLDSLRGPHSTGLGKVLNNNRYLIVKEVGSPFNLFYKKEFQPLLDLDPIDTLALIGHNRFATKGEIKPENAHPFYHDNILLAHNGTVYNYEKLLPNNHFETDSETITKSISLNGIKWVWDTINGAAALTYYDFNDNSMNLITNGQRPLFFVTTKSQMEVFWASEDWMLEVAIGRELKFFYSGFSKIEELDDHILYKFKLNDKSKLTYTKTNIRPKHNFYGLPQIPYTPYRAQGPVLSADEKSNNLGNIAYYSRMDNLKCDVCMGDIPKGEGYRMYKKHRICQICYTTALNDHMALDQLIAMG